ncbi:CMGC/CDK protein kinase [Coniosporium apollinis CBS 100218]|uniref:CMGC/CDK protein kinase n=1 Tax=Coniosporium apollinis (strain CBS 100218) TaxID=1168221 RepID=R7YG32_CONA1|nr:CMGC/CDK protein kinase [Coniosporium apollinis CBS 100218]EON60848.1 CMGC/CDK protein kinase [Coniosporium apollinis CBS 100218]
MTSHLDLYDAESLRAKIGKKTHDLFKAKPVKPQLQVNRFLKTGNGVRFARNRDVEDVSQLEALLHESNDSSQIFVIRQDRSWTTLNISQELFEDFISVYGVFSQLWNITFTFGRKCEENEFAFPGFRARRTPRSGSSPNEFYGWDPESAYILRRAELNHRMLTEGQSPWSVRQTAVYHKLGINPNETMSSASAHSSPLSRRSRSTFLLIAPSQSLEKQLAQSLEMGISNECAVAQCNVHRLLVADSLGGWTEYMAWLEERLSDQSNRMVFAKVGTEKEYLSPLTDFNINFIDRQTLKLLEDSVIDLEIILSTMLNTIVGIREHCRKCCERYCREERKGDCDCDQIVEEFDEHVKEVDLHVRRVKLLRERAKSTTQLEKSTKDAAAVKVLTVIGLVYLPSTIVAAIEIPAPPTDKNYDSPEPSNAVPEILIDEPEPLPGEDAAPPQSHASTRLNSSRRNSNSSLPKSHGGSVSRQSRSRSSSENSATAGSLRGHLESARKECPPGSHLFIVPNCAQESLITIAAVAKEIQAGNRFGPAEAVERAKEVCQSARHLFAILAYMKRGAEICTLLEEGVSDKDLPLLRRSDGQQRFALKLKKGESLKTMEKWSDKDLEKFDRYQYWMTAPVFKDKRHYNLHDNTILPFIPFKPDAETEEPKQGGYSEVYPVRVHPSHHQFWKRSASEIDEPLIAIKKLFSSDRTEFAKEQTILIALGSRNHPHLIKLLATFQHKQKYHLMFPYANANLRKYWEDRPHPNFDEATVLWSLKQMTGIANALWVIHNFTLPLPVDGQVRVLDDGILSVEKEEKKFGRHGDIKPENILWFKQSSEVEDENGVLQIADFGLGRFHGRDSRSKINPATVWSSPTYEPPECKLRRSVSRSYDIWSLGCLYLEFITWLLMGSAEIEGFSDYRARCARTGINDDNFYTIYTRSGNRPGAEVRGEVTEWVNKLHEHGKCSAVIHGLLELIMEQLLIIDSTERIDAAGLFRKLDIFLERAKTDKPYLLDPLPRAQKAGSGMPPSRTLGALSFNQELSNIRGIWFFVSREPRVLC